MRLLTVVSLVMLLMSCSKKSLNTLADRGTMEAKMMDVQGHRGCRGLLPENTIPAFLKAMDIGVTTLEMDLVISSDKEVFVSHEPFFNHEISTAPNGDEITEENERSHNVYMMTAVQAKAYDVGMKTHSRFPDQQNMPVAKPLFKEVIAAAESYAKEKGLPLPFYNVEIKRVDGYDGQFHPTAEEFSRLVVDVINEGNIKSRCYIQSFDPESLRQSRLHDPAIKLVLLIQNQDGIAANLKNLGFVPEVYSPYFKLVNEELVSYCKKENIALIPWTVNTREEIESMVALGVDGIISDFPDLLMDILKEKNIPVLH